MHQRPESGSDLGQQGSLLGAAGRQAEGAGMSVPLPPAPAVGTFYDVLGLRAYESDVNAIRSAVEAKLAELKVLQTRLEPSLFQRFALDVQSAQTTLLDPIRKQTYDMTLLYRGNAVQPPAVQAPTRPGPRAAGGDRAVHACPRCAWQNTADREFCGGCGTPLWEPCLSCGATLGVWEKFCGTCGGNVAATFQERGIEFRQKQQQAAALAQIGRLEESVALLEPIIAVEHPRLSDLIQRVRQEYVAYKSQLEHVTEFSEQSLRDAREAAHQRDWQRAAQLIHATPETHRGAAAFELLKECQTRIAEIGRLSAQVREAIEKKQVSKIMPWLERLIELQPKEQAWPNLVQKIRQADERRRQNVCDQAISMAESSLMRKDFRQALETLERVPAEARHAGWERVHKQVTDSVKEVSYLREHVGNRLFVDEHYLGVLEHLTALVPTDIGIAKQAMQLKEQIEFRAKAGKKPPSPWSGKEYDLGGLPAPALPVPALFAMDAVDDFDASEFNMNTGAYAVAAGLALHAIGTGLPRFGFYEAEAQTSFSKLFGRSKQDTLTTAWGLDLGNAAVKAVLLQYNKTDGKISIRAAWRKESEELALTTDPNKANELRNAIAGEFLEQHKLEDADKVCAGFNGQELLLRSFRVPAKATGKTLISLIQHEASKQIPFPLEHTFWKYEVGPAPDSTTGEQEVRLFAAKKAIIMQALAPWHNRKIKVHSVQSNATALHHLTRFLQDRKGEGDESCAAILDIGHQETLLVVSQANRFWHRGIAHGGAAFDRAITRALAVTREQAVKIRHSPVGLEQLHPLFVAFDGLANQLRVETSRSMAFVSQHFRHGPLRRIYLAGNCVRMHGLLENLVRPPTASETGV